MKIVKIKRVFANNRKKVFVIEAGGNVYEFPYSKLSLKPSAEDRIAEVFPDKEIGREGFTYKLESGKEDTVHIDHVLEVNCDPDYLCDLLLYQMTVEALTLVQKTKVSRAEIARRLRTSPKQLSRLLDTTFYGKTINQMVKLLFVLGKHVRFVADKKAA